MTKTEFNIMLKQYFPLVPAEFVEYIQQVFEGGVTKGYEPNGWQQGIKFNHRDNHASLSRHIAEGYIGATDIVDKESGLHPYKHLAIRALMEVWLLENTDILHKRES